MTSSGSQAYIEQLNKAQIFRKPIVTQLVPLNGFYAAEEHHQHLDRNPNHPYIVVHDLPKLAQLGNSSPPCTKVSLGDKILLFAGGLIMP